MRKTLTLLLILSKKHGIKMLLLFSIFALQSSYTSAQLVKSEYSTRKAKKSPPFSKDSIYRKANSRRSGNRWSSRGDSITIKGRYIFKDTVTRSVFQNDTVNGRIRYKPDTSRQWKEVQLRILSKPFRRPAYTSGRK